MSTRIYLWRALFGEKPRILLENSDFTVTSFRYDSGVEGLKIANSRGHLIILPWMGQMIWDAQFDGHSLTMCNMFRQPKPATEVIETYGCFAFHSGLLANGCPSAEDTHLLHGEMACAAMDEAWRYVTPYRALRVCNGVRASLSGSANSGPSQILYIVRY